MDEPVTASSITAEHQALLAVLENAVDAIISINTAGEIQSFNPAAERMFKRSAASVLGRNLKLLMPEPHRHRHDDYLKNYLRTGEKHIIGIGREVDCLRADGTEFPADLSVSESRIGDQVLFTGIIRDLSERNRIREALKRKEQELSLTVQHAPIGIVTMEPTGRVVTINRAARRITGYDTSEIVGEYALNFMHVDDQGALRRAFREIVTGNTEYSSSTHELRSAEGEYIPIRTYNAAVYDSEKRALLLICMFQDLTEQYANEAELQTQRERLAHVARLNTMGEMAVGLAHELNQPLAAISAYAQAGKRFLACPADNAADLSHACEQIAKQAERAGDVIKKIRQLTRQSEWSREAIDINTLVSDLMTLIEIDARHADVRMRTDLAALPRVHADSVQIEQVILNFVRNAIDAVKALDRTRREISVRTDQTGNGEVRVSVIDRGPGIGESESRQLFESFYTTKTGGMGMGLSISKSIISAHDGRIGHSHNPDGGAVFWFTLPVLADEGST